MSAPVYATQELAELLAEEGLEPAAKLTGKSGSTLWRWIKVGVRGVRLEAVQDGRQYMTSKAAVARFRARQFNLSLIQPTPTSGSMARQAAAAKAEIRRIRAGRKKG